LNTKKDSDSSIVHFNIISTMGKKDKEFGSQVNLIESGNDSKKKSKNGDSKSGLENHPPPIPQHQHSLKRSTRQNSFEFDTVRPEQKVLTADEKV
jgi:hypothetical protein